MVVLPFKHHSRVFSNKAIEKDTRQQRGDAAVVYCGGTCGDKFVYIFIVVDSTRMTQPILRPTYLIFIIDYHEWTVYAVHC